MTFPEFLYYLGYSIKKRYALKNQKRLPHRVISIGNLTLGGTGKTPATIALAQEAKKRGFKPCILTRGYKGKAKGPRFVSKEEGPLLDEYQAGDEALLMAQKLRGIPVIKGGDRYKAGLFALSSLSHSILPNLFVLDDGFQHRKLFRDKDILLIDSTNPFGNRKMLPLGPLREPLKGINRADIIVITKTNNSAKSLIEEIKKYNSKASIFLAEHMPSDFAKPTGEAMPLDWAKGKTFFAFCGIGNPTSFRSTLISANIELKGSKNFRDHYRYNHHDIQAIIKEAEKCNADWIVTTEKDIMRLKGFPLPENFVSLLIDFSVDAAFYEEALKTLTYKV